MPSYVTCPNGHRNTRAGGREKCAEPDCGATLRRLAKPQHAAIMREGYEPFVRAAAEIHGVTDESCCACGTARGKTRPDRDHDHVTGRARGLLCRGNSGCNVLILPWVSAATAEGIAAAKLAAGEPDAGRWRLIADYLRRVDAFYARAVNTGAVTDEDG